MMLNALGTAATPRLVQTYRDEWRAYLRLTAKLVAAGAVAGAIAVLGAWLMGTTVLTILYAEDYAAFSGEFTVLSVSLGLTFMLSFINHSLVASRAFVHVLIIDCIVAAICGLACYVLIPGQGVMGACQAAVITNVAWLLLLALVYAGRLNVRARQTELAASGAV
jgi:O-antigen/teichoic acid export membrane protein